MLLDTLTIVGVGLIGGSIGLAVKKRGLARRVLGVGWRQATLDQAQRLGAIDQGFLELAPAVAESNLIVFCTPVQMIAEQALEAASHCRSGTLLTDAGSTKAAIVASLDGRLPRDRYFIGSHPLAGSEKRGPEHADASLFQNRLTLMTPTPASDPQAVEQVAGFWRALGSRIRYLSPQEHDEALALTSHVPHLLASALAGALPGELRDLTASGFRDTTRIAAGDPRLWTGIFLQNRDAVLAALDRVREQTERFREALAAGDESALNALLDQAKRVRDALGS
jgi:prephenate dehydrogenase